MSPGAKRRATLGTGQLDRFLNGRCQGRGVRALNGIDDGAVVQNQEGGHGAHTVLLRHFTLAIDIDLAECNLLRLGVLGRKGLECGRDHLAWAAPIGINWGSHC